MREDLVDQIRKARGARHPMGADVPSGKPIAKAGWRKEVTMNAVHKKTRNLGGIEADHVQQSMWDVGTVLEGARKSAWVAATACEENGKPELAQQLDAIANHAGTVEAEMKALYWKVFGMVKPNTAKAAAE